MGIPGENKFVGEAKFPDMGQVVIWKGKRAKVAGIAGTKGKFTYRIRVGNRYEYVPEKELSGP